MNPDLIIANFDLDRPVQLYGSRSHVVRPAPETTWIVDEGGLAWEDLGGVARFIPWHAISELLQHPRVDHKSHPADPSEDG